MSVDISLGPLKIEVVGRSDSSSDDYWDGNWVTAIAKCETNGASVSVTGDFIHLTELTSFLAEVQRLSRTLSGEATLKCMEPNLYVAMLMDKSGRIAVTVKLSPDPKFQRHEFNFHIDQSYLPALIDALSRLLQASPVIGSQRR